MAQEVLKLAAKYFGPYKIIDKIGHSVCKFDFPAYTGIRSPCFSCFTIEKRLYLLLKLLLHCHLHYFLQLYYSLWQYWTEELLRKVIQEPLNGSFIDPTLLHLMVLGNLHRNYNKGSLISHVDKGFHWKGVLI